MDRRRLRMSGAPAQAGNLIILVGGGGITDTFEKIFISRLTVKVTPDKSWIL